MSEPGVERPTRAWVLGGTLGAVALVIALVAVVGFPTAIPPQEPSLRATA